MGRGQSIDSAGDACGELVVWGWVRPKVTVAEDGGREWYREQVSRTRLNCFHCSSNH